MFVTELTFQGKSGFRLFPSRNAHAQNTRSLCQHPRQALSPLPPCTTGLQSSGRPRQRGKGGRWECFLWSREVSALLRAARLRAGGAVCRGLFSMKSLPTGRKQPRLARSTSSLGCLPSTRRESENAQVHPGISGGWLDENLGVNKSHHCLLHTEPEGKAHSRGC